MTETDRQAQPSNRPKWHITIAIMIVIFEVISIVQTLQLPDSIRQQLTIIVNFQIVFGIIWSMVFLFALYFLLQRHPKAQRLTSWLVISFVGYRLLRLIVFVQADYDRQRLLFLSLFILLVCSVPIWKLLQPDRDSNHT